MIILGYKGFPAYVRNQPSGSQVVSSLQSVVYWVVVAFRWDNAGHYAGPSEYGLKCRVANETGLRRFVSIGLSARRLAT